MRWMSHNSVLIKYVGMDRVVIKYGYTVDKLLIYCRYIRTLSTGHPGSVQTLPLPAVYPPNVYTYLRSTYSKSTLLSSFTGYR